MLGEYQFNPSQPPFEKGRSCHVTHLIRKSSPHFEGIFLIRIDFLPPLLKGDRGGFKQSNHLNLALTNASLHPVSNLYALHNPQADLEKFCPR